MASAAAVAVLLSAAPSPGGAFAPEIMDSVVAVLPQWPGGAPGTPGGSGRSEEPEGTAVAVFPGGFLATNVHVLRAAREVRVRLHDGRIVSADIVGRDPLTDIALIKVDADLPVPTVGPEPALAAPVCAIGNQFGLGLSVTCGVVSAVHRTGTGFNPVEDFIQTDAAVNPGGSGGALIDADGRLIGLVSAIFTKQSDANIGINFAASMDLVRRVARDLKDHGRVRRGKSGLRVGDLPPEERARLAGARITRIKEGAAAAAAGLAVGDVVTAVGKRTIRKASDVTGAIYLQPIGAPFAVTVVRAGRRLTVTLTLRP